MKVINQGRFTLEKDGVAFYNTGSGISFLAKGDRAFVDVTSKTNSGFLYIIKNFDYENKEKIFIENHKKVEILLDKNKPIRVDLVKANEAADNTLIFGPVLCSGELLDIDENDKKFVKVYGDSSIAGYGILAHEGEANIYTNDGIENFCFRALYSLGFKFDIFAHSGWGLCFSEWTNPKTVGIEKFRDNISVFSDKKFPQITPDFLIISLGTNDVSFIDRNKEISKELIGKFEKSYENLIKKERGKNTEIPVLMVCGSLKENPPYFLVEKTYEKLSKKLPNIHLVNLPGDNSAISFHSYVSYHAKMAEILKEKIVQILS